MNYFQRQIEQLQQLLQRLPGRSDALLWQVFVAVAIVAVVYLVYRWIVRALAALAERGRLSQQMFVILRRIVYWTFCLFAVLLVLQQFGWMAGAWATLTAVLALVAIGFVAMWSVLSNAFCSILLMITRPFNVGDTIELPADNLGGKVIDFNLIYTTLRDEDGSLLQVPNNQFFQKAIRRRVGERTITLDQQADRERPTQ